MAKTRSNLGVAPKVHEPWQIARASYLQAHPSTSTVMFALIGRDVEDELPHVLRNIERLAQIFRRAHVLLVENDPNDNTTDVFKTWAKGAPSPIEAQIRSMPNGQWGKKRLALLAKSATCTWQP